MRPVEAVLLAELAPERVFRAVLRERFHAHVHEHQPSHPAEATLAAQLVGEAEHAHPVLRPGRDQGGLGREALGEIQLLDPGRARTLVVPHHHRRARLCGPLEEFAVGAVEAELRVGAPRARGDDRHVVELFHVADALAGLAPHPGIGVGSQHDPQPGHAPGLGDARILQCDVIDADLAGHDRLRVRVNMAFSARSDAG
jgi:hypothetical protein